jgi:type IV pilus assembly protein PilC
MALYKCKLGVPDGSIIVKEIESPGIEVLRQNLEDQGFFVFEISKKSFQFFGESASSRKRVDNKTLLTFNQELLVLIKAGLPIIQALDAILEKGEKNRFYELLANLREEIKGGASLSEALEMYPGAFPHLYVASIRAGERTGDLPQTIRRFVQFVKRAEGFKKKVLSALFYPSFLIVAVSLAVTLLLVYVVPTFSQIYSESGAQLPLPTLMLINFTSVLRMIFPLLIVALVASVYGVRHYGRTPSGRHRLDLIKLRIPFVGKLVEKYSITSFTRTLGTVLASGIPVVESLKMTVGTLNNRVLERRLLEATRKVEEGMNLSVALESVHIMPMIALRMIAVGETTGALEEMLVDISEYFEDEIDQQLHLLTTAIEPVIMIVMGAVIGGIIVTMYLPIFKIAGAMG